MPNSAELLLIPVSGGSSPPKTIADPSRHREDEKRWLDVKDYSIFLNDGVLWTYGLVPCPLLDKHPAGPAISATDDQDLELPANSGSKISEIQERLLALCSSSPSQLRLYHTYQYSLFQEMWLWKYRNALKADSDNLKLRANRTAPPAESESAFTASTVSLMLLVPLLKSQATVDNDLAINTAKVLLGMLLESPGTNLNGDLHAPWDDLESLFAEWIQERGDAFREIGSSVMVGLCCARGSLTSMLNTIHLLHVQGNLNARLPVNNILQNLPNVDFRIGKAPRIAGTQHLCTWQYDDQIDHLVENTPTPESLALSNDASHGVGLPLNWHALAVDGTYLYVTACRGYGLAKIGSGLNGSLQGLLYRKNDALYVDFLAYGNGILLARLAHSHSSKVQNPDEPFATVIDAETLTVGQEVVVRTEDKLNGSCAVIGFTSDGFYFYVINVQFPEAQSSEEAAVPLNIFLSVYDIVKSTDGNFYAVLKCPHILLKREVDLEPVPETDGSRRPRLSYLAAAVQTPPPPTTPAADPYSDRMTSLGIRFRDLMSASFIATGGYVTIFTEYAHAPPAPATSPLLQSINRHFGNTGATALHNPKATGTQIHVCLHGVTPTYSKHPFGTLPARSSFQRGLNTVVQTGFAYDATNDLIWTISGEYADAWKNTGNVPNWKARKQLLLPESKMPDLGSSDIDVQNVLEVLWAHVGLQASHALQHSSLEERGKMPGFDANVSKIWGIVKQMDTKTLSASEITAILTILQSAILKMDVKTATAVPGITVFQEIQSFALSFFTDNYLLLLFGASPNVYVEASKLTFQCSESTCMTLAQRSEFAETIFKSVESLNSEAGEILKKTFLEHLTQRLEKDGVLFENGQFWILPPRVLRKLIGEDAVQGTLDTFDVHQTLMTKVVQVPLVSPATAYISAVVNSFLKSWTLASKLNLKEHYTFPASVVQVLKTVLNHSSTIVDRAIEFVMAGSEEPLSLLINAENILKSSLIGLVIPQIYLWLCEHSSRAVCDTIHPPHQPCPVVEEVAEECIQLFVALSHLLDRMAPSTLKDETQENGFNVTKVSPLQNCRLFESPHPLKENTKIRESIIFTGAKHLYVKIDPRSATQYDYDKFVLFSGTGPNAKRIAEYGGNFYGFGNRAGSPPFWTRDLVKIDSDTVSYSLEIQSGKEHQTPPEAVWGFAFVVFPVYEHYTSAGSAIDLESRTQSTKSGVVLHESLFIDKLYLAAVDSMTCLLTKLMNGETPTALELEMPALFTNKLFSRLKWPNAQRIPAKEILLKEISSNEVLKLRQIGNAGALPQMGKKLREILKAEEIEKLYVLACLNYIGKSNVAYRVDSAGKSNFAETSLGSSDPSVLHVMFQHLDSFIRKFLSIAEIQLRVKTEVEQVVSGANTMDALYEIVNLQDMETLALIFDIHVNPDDSESVLADVRSILEAFVAEGTCPQLTKAEDLIEETCLKLRSIIASELVENGTIQDDAACLKQVRNFAFAHLSNQKASMAGILDVVSSHSVRAASRCQGLQLLLKLLECSKHNAHSVLMASRILEQSQRTENIACSGFVPEVNDLVSRGIQLVVEKAEANPFLHRHAIALLCTFPYKREDEKTLVSSGLLEVLDTLCGLQVEELQVPSCQKTLDEGASDAGNSDVAKSTTSLAWAAFQILAHRCSSWESLSQESSDELEGLSIKISRNVTNHLARVAAMTQVPSEVSEVSSIRVCGHAQSKGMEDILALLDTLRGTTLGQEILKQSGCICRLLLIFLDPRQPPSTVLTIIRLLSTALPLVENLDTSDLNAGNVPLLKKKGIKEPNPHSLVVSLLLSKLAEYLVVCGTPQSATNVESIGKDTASENAAGTSTNVASPHQTPPLPVITVGQQGTSSTFKAKLAISEKKCLEKNVFLERHDAPRNFLSGEVAAELALEVRGLLQQLQAGETWHGAENGGESSSGITVTSASSVAQNAWTTAVEQALAAALKPLGKLTGVPNLLTVSLESYANSARIAIAALGVLGAMDEGIKSGSEVWIQDADQPLGSESDFLPTKVRILSLCESSGIATVQYLNGANEHRNLAPAKTLRVPISRLSLSKYANSSSQLDVGSATLQELASHLKCLLLPAAASSKYPEGICPMKRSIPSLDQILCTGTFSPPACSESKLAAQRMTVVRLVAEIRTRAAQVLSIWLKKPEFLELFLGIVSEGGSMSPDAGIVVSALNDISKECKPACRLRSVEGQVARLRLWYRDCTKPPRLPSPKDTVEVSEPNTSSAPVFFANRDLVSTVTTSDSGIRFRRITDSLQEISIGPLFPYLANIDSDSDLSFAMTDEDGDDNDDEPESDYVSPLSSRNDLDDQIDAMFIELDEGEYEAMVEYDQEEDTTEEMVPLFAEINIASPSGGATPFLENSSANATRVQQDVKPKNRFIEQKVQPLIAKPKSETKEYSPSAILECYLSPSTTYDIRVFSGPNPYVCPCSRKLASDADLLSLEDEGSEAGPSRGHQSLRASESLDPVQDAHQLLLKAWETKVFPLIRRRFRNESERRDGLEQIRNALTLGMIDIARQTVEFLYEENGGIPRDLHLPTLEEVKFEASRFTLDRIKLGMNVLIHPIRTKSDADDSGIPKYAVSSMLKTFGLIGEVLEVDEAHELILIESYVESDGVLQRFWYPLKSLERLAGEKRSPLNARGVSMLKLHSNLMDLESSLTQLYCRKAYLEVLNMGFQEQQQIFQNEISGPSASSGSIASLFEEVDLGNLQIRSQESFVDFPLNGNLLTWNLASGAPSIDFLTVMGNQSVLFFKESAKLSIELRRAIENVLRKDSQKGVVMLTSQLCSVLDSADKFLVHEIPLDKEASFDVSLPGVAFCLVSVEGPVPKKSSPVLNVLSRDPCVHVFATNSGDLRTCPLVCYPVQTLSTLLKSTTSAFGSISPGPGIQDRKSTAFPPVLVPTDRIKCTVQHGTLPGHKLQVLGISAEFPLALLYCQQLIDAISGLEETSEARIHLLSILLTFVEKYSLPPLMKEWIFKICSGILSFPTVDNWAGEFCLEKSDFINRLFTEAVILYERETKLQTQLTLNINFPFCIVTSRSDPRSAGPSRSARQNRNRAQIAANQSAKTSNLADDASEQKLNDLHGIPIVSSYFQALFELCLFLAEVCDLTYTPSTLSLPMSPDHSPPSTPSSTSTSVTPLEVSVPRVGPFRRRSKGSKQGSASPKFNGWKRVGKGFQPDAKSPGPAPATVQQLQVKMDDFSVKTSAELKWFRQAAYALHLLWTFSSDESCRKNTSLGREVVENCLKEMKPSTIPGRLFVIYGAPKNIPKMPVENSISRALNQYGGIFGNELWFSEDRTEIVVEIRSSARADEAYTALSKNLTWYPLENFILHPAVSVLRVSSSLETGNRRADTVLAEYLQHKIFSQENPDRLSKKVTETFSAIFTSCYVFNDNDGQFDAADLDESGLLLLTKKHILNDSGDQNLMKTFVAAVKPTPFELDYFVQQILKKFGRRRNSTEKSSCSESSENPVSPDSKKLNKDLTKSAEKEVVGTLKPMTDEGLGLSESGFLEWCTQLAKDNLTGLWRALLETGHDFRLEKCWISDSTNLIQAMTGEGWTKQQDAALVTYVNDLVSKLRISPQAIHPHEIYLDERVLMDPALKPLRGIPIENVRTRFAILQHINQAVHFNLMPFVPLNIGLAKTRIASVLHETRYLFFYNTKDEFLYKVFHNSAHRGHDIPPPEVTLDPIRHIGTPVTDPMQTMFSSAVCQLSQVPSQTFCVPPATGADPPLAMVVKFAGEEVQGIIGSFRHFLGKAVQEFQESALGFFIPCPSAAAGRNKDSLVLRPGPMTYGEGRLLQCLGQFIGICLRADVPVPLTLLASVWRSLLNVSEELNEVNDDLKEADVLTAAFLEAFDMDGVDETAFQRILESRDVTTFQYISMDGSTLVPLCPGGANLNLRFANKSQFVRLVKKLREKELLSSGRVRMVLAGLSTILPLTFFFNGFTSCDLRARVSGSPEINLSLLKAHTHYQMGLCEADPHIQFFWTALESMSPEELKNFVKFATNQDRLPTSCPCENGLRLAGSAHVPPFPMKLSPIDLPQGVTEAYINQRTIRAETCLFLIRLPPYTTYQVTRDQLLYAANSRDDPLSG